MTKRTIKKVVTGHHPAQGGIQGQSFCKEFMDND